MLTDQEEMFIYCNDYQILQPLETRIMPNLYLLIKFGKIMNIGISHS